MGKAKGVKGANSADSAAPRSKKTTGIVKTAAGSAAASGSKQQPQPLALPKVSSKASAPKVNWIAGDALFSVDGVLTSAEAERFVAAIESSGQLTHQSSRGPKYGEAFRDNDRCAVQDERFAAALWGATGLDRIFAGIGEVEGSTAVGLNPNIRLYRYTPGQRFGRHIDESNELGAGRFTLYTLLIYLSGGTAGQAAPGGRLVGGETLFYGNRGKLLASVSPVAGTALLHMHGDFCLEHEAAEVKAGAKYVLRSDVVFERVC